MAKSKEKKVETKKEDVKKPEEKKPEVKLSDIVKDAKKVVASVEKDDADKYVGKKYPLTRSTVLSSREQMISGKRMFVLKLSDGTTVKHSEKELRQLGM